LVQQLLSTIASGMGQCNVNMEADKMLIPLQYLTKVLGLLVNPSVTEINCTVLDSVNSRKFNNFLLKHTLKNCPKISKIELMNKKAFMHLLGKRDILPVDLFKKSWSDLKSIRSRNDYLSTDDTLKFIQENFPNIESVICPTRDDYYFLIFNISTGS